MRISIEPNFFFGVGDQAGDLGGLTHICTVVDAFDAKFGLDGLALLLDLLGRAEAVDDDIGPFPGESPGIGQTDAAG